MIPKPQNIAEKDLMLYSVMPMACEVTQILGFVLGLQGFLDTSMLVSVVRTVCVGGTCPT